MYVASLKNSENYKAPSYQYASPSKQILKAKAKPYPSCTHCGFNDHRPGDYRNYPECAICGSYDHFTSRHNHVILVRGGVLAESSQSSESLIGRHVKEPIWYLDSGCSRSVTGVKSYMHKDVEQPGPKIVFGDNSSCITKGYGSKNCGGIVFSKVAFVNGLKYNLINISQLCDAKYIIQFDDKQGIIFNANKEIVLIAPRRNDVYVLDMSSLTPNRACFFAKALKSVNWLWHKRLSHLNFKNINKLAKQNKVLGLPSLVYSKDKPSERKNRTLIEAARIMLNGSVLSKQSWTKTVRISCYTQNRSITVKRHDKTPYDILRERIPDISYFHVFGCPVFIHNHKDHLGKIDAKANDGYFLAYLFNSKAFRVFNTRRQQIKETYHVTYDESMEAIGFTNTLVNEIRINDSSRYPLDEFLQENDLSRQYQANSDISYYIIPHNCSLTKLTNDTHVPEVITPNDQNTPHTKDVKGPPDQVNTKEIQEQFSEVTQSQITHHASKSSYPAPQDRWSRDQHIKLVKLLIDEPTKGMLTESMAAKLTTASTRECLFADFLFETEPKKMPEALKRPWWIAIDSKLVFMNKKDEHRIVKRNKARLVALGYSQEVAINYDEAFAPVAKMEAIRIFLAYATYMNFNVF
ncbi:retrovirus-related pol polyprotein from transposon TNT 1-94 [Tanacetum coccineum]